MNLDCGLCSICPGQSSEMGPAGNHHQAGVLSWTVVDADPSSVRRSLFPRVIPPVADPSGLWNCCSYHCCRGDVFKRPSPRAYLLDGQNKWRHVLPSSRSSPWFPICQMKKATPFLWEICMDKSLKSAKHSNSQKGVI